MIVNNKMPNVRIFSYKTKTSNNESYFMFPGINGEVPDAVAESPAFKEQRAASAMVVIEGKKDLIFDTTRTTMKPDALAKVPDLDVVETILAMPEEKALALMPDLVKEPTLKVLRSRETRASLIAAIDSQIENIDKMNIAKTPR